MKRYWNMLGLSIVPLGCMVAIPVFGVLWYLVTSIAAFPPFLHWRQARAEKQLEYTQKFHLLESVHRPKEATVLSATGTFRNGEIVFQLPETKLPDKWLYIVWTMNPGFGSVVHKGVNTIGSSSNTFQIQYDPVAKRYHFKSQDEITESQ